ncbi:hypothetical protein COBT_002969, partial [Conglomerata obtusa]
MDSSSENNEHFQIQRDSTLTDLAYIKGFKLKGYYDGPQDLFRSKSRDTKNLYQNHERNNIETMNTDGEN